jgi:hypothetical protein
MKHLWLLMAIAAISMCAPFATAQAGGDGSTCTESGACNTSPDSCGKAGPI